MNGILIFSLFFLIIFILLLLFYILILRKSQKEYIQSYPGAYICDDGHKVRSLSELVIDNALSKYNIKHNYEDYISKKSDEPKFKYDFYLPDYDVYIEFFGFSGRNYFRNKKIKENFYKQKNLKLIVFEPKDLAEINKSLREKLIIKKFDKNKFCPRCGCNLDERF